MIGMFENIGRPSTMRLSKFWPGRHRRRVEQRRFGRHGHLFADLADLERERQAHLLADGQHDAGARQRLEAGHLDRHLVVARLQQRRFEVAAAVGDELLRRARVGVVIFTVAPGTTPWESLTVPEILPRVSCALAGTATKRTRTKTRKSVRINPLLFLSAERRSATPAILAGRFTGNRIGRMLAPCAHGRIAERFSIPLTEAFRIQPVESPVRHSPGNAYTTPAHRPGQARRRGDASPTAATPPTAGRAGRGHQQVRCGRPSRYIAGEPMKLPPNHDDHNCLPLSLSHARIWLSRPAPNTRPDSVTMMLLRICGTPVPVTPRPTSEGSSPNPMRHLMAGSFKSYFTIVVNGGFMREPIVPYSLITKRSV